MTQAFSPRAANGAAPSSALVRSSARMAIIAVTRKWKVMHTLADLAGNKTICVVSMIDKNSIKGAQCVNEDCLTAVLRAFEATVRYGSVSKAAKSLNVTDGAVSRAVREFEQTTDSRCFNAPAAWCIRRRRRKSWRARSAGAGQPAVGDRPRLSASSESPVGDLLRADLSDPLADPASGRFAAGGGERTRFAAGLRRRRRRLLA